MPSAARTLALAVALSPAGLVSQQHIGPVTSIARLADGRIVACSQAGILTGVERPELFWDPPFRVVDLHATPDALLIAGGDPGRRAAIAVWRRSGKEPAVVRFGDDLCTSVRRRGDDLVFGTVDGRVRTMRLDSLQVGRVLWTHPGAVRGLASSGDRLVSAGLGGNLFVGPLFVGTEARVLTDHTAGIECVAVTDRGTTGSGARDGRVRVHDAAGRLLRSTARSRARVLCIEAHGQEFWYGTDAGSVFRLREGDKPQQIASFASPVYSLAHDGTRWLAGLSGELRPIDS